MNITGIRYERFSEKDYNAARELLSYDVDAGENILRVLAEEPELFITAFIENKLVALAQVNEPASQTYLTISCQNSPTFLNAYKSASSRLIKKEFPIIRKQLWKEYFWSRSYCLITTGGAPIDVIKKYIETQGEKTR